MIRNKTRKTILSKNAKYATSFADKTFGMLLKQNSNGIIFKTRFGIHTFFMGKPIDVIVLDSENKVVKMKSRLMPNSIFIWNPKFGIVVELPAGTIRKSKTEVGDKISF